MADPSPAALLHDAGMRWTVAQYERAAEAGVFDRGPRVELIQGEVVTVSPVLPPHAKAVRALCWAAYRQLSEDQWTIGCLAPIRLHDFSAPEPDLWIAEGGGHTYDDDHPTGPELTLVVEVAGSTLAFDRTVKVPDYAAARIEHLWLVAVPDRSVTVYTSPIPAERRYGEASSLRPGDILVHPPTGLRLAVSELF